MKIAIILGNYCTEHNLINLSNFLNDPIGQSGTNILFIRLSEAMAARGHEVAIFSLFSSKPNEMNGMKVYDLHRKAEIITSDWDCIVTISEPDQLRDLPQEPLRIVSQQLNGFSYCQPGFDDFVDLWLSPSNSHRERHLTAYGQSFDPDKWKVLRDGCFPDDYTPDVKVPGRVVFISSADRGLHILLQEWSKIKAAVPHASLRVFYNFAYGDLRNYEKGIYQQPNSGPDIFELAQRIRYIEEMAPRLKHLDVEHVGSVSRERIAREVSEAECLAYPCSTVVYSEGFSISTLEAMNCKSCPVITKCDALEDIYGGVVPMVDTPVLQHAGEFSDLVIKALTDKEYRNEVNERCRAFALEHSWDKIAEGLESMIVNHPKVKERGGVAPIKPKEPSPPTKRQLLLEEIARLKEAVARKKT